MISHANRAVNRPAGNFGHAHRTRPRKPRTGTRNPRSRFAGFRPARVYFPAPIQDREVEGFARLVRGGALEFTPALPAALPPDALCELYPHKAWRRVQWLRPTPYVDPFAPEPGQEVA